MKKWILGSVLLSLMAWGATPPTAKDAAYDKYQNKVINPGAENGTSNVSVSAGTLTVTTTSSEIGTGARAFKWCPATAGNTLSFNNYAIEPGLKGNNGRVELSAQSATNDYSFRVWDGSNTIGTATTMTNISSYSSAGYDFGFPSSGNARVQVLSASAANCIFLDDVYLGKSDRLAKVSQASFVGSAYFPVTASCSWSRTNTAVGAFGTDTDCPGPTVEKQIIGSWQTTDADLPRVTINNLPAGLYKVTVTGQAYASADWTMAVSDGTDTRGYASGSLNAAQPATVSTAWFEYTSSGNRTFEVYGSSSSGAISLDNNSSNDRLSFVIERYPLSSQTFVSADQSDYDWVSYTPTFTGFGTVSSIEIQHARTNSNLYIRGKFTCGTSTATEARISLPGALVSAGTSVIPSIQVGGMAQPSTNTGQAGFVLIEPSTAYMTFGLANGGAAGPLTKRNGSTFCSSGESVSIWASFPISGWTSSMRAPSLIGSYTSSGSASFRQEFATIANSGTPTVSRTSSSWISSLTDNGTGDTTINITSGYCATVPTCVLTPSPNSDQGSMMQFLDFSTARTTTVVRVRTLNGASSPVDQGFDIVCMCQRN